MLRSPLHRAGSQAAESVEMIEDPRSYYTWLKLLQGDSRALDFGDKWKDSLKNVNPPERLGPATGFQDERWLDTLSGRPDVESSEWDKVRDWEEFQKYIQAAVSIFESPLYEGRAGQGINSSSVSERGSDMPSWVKDHDTWERAKEEVKRKPDMSDDAYWGSVTTVYKNMGGEIKSKDSSFAGELDRIAYDLSQGGMGEISSRLCRLRDRFLMADSPDESGPFDDGEEEEHPEEEEPEEEEPEEEAWWERDPYIPLSINKVKEEVKAPISPDYAPEDDNTAKGKKLRQFKDRLLATYYMNLYQINPKDKTIPRWYRDWIEEKQRQDAEDEARLIEMGKDSSISLCSRLTKAVKRAFTQGDYKSTARFMVARDMLVADLDPFGGDIPDPSDTETMELVAMDTYQGEEVSSSPGIAVKVEEGQVQIYVIDDPVDEIYGEIYLDKSEKGWTAAHIEEHLPEDKASVIPSRWSEGKELRHEDVTEWLAGEVARFGNG